MSDPITLYSPDAGPLTLADLTAAAPADAELTENHAGALVAAWPDLRITIHTMPDEDRPEHLAGFSGFIEAQAADADEEAVDSLLERIAAVQAVFGCLVEPEFDGEGRWFELVGRLAAARSAMGVLSDGSVVNERLERIFEPVFDDDEYEADPPDVATVHRRMLAMTALVQRGFIELAAAGNAEADAALEVLQAWVARTGLTDALEPHEAEFVTVGRGEGVPQHAIDATWASEGLVVLAWALGLVDSIPPPDEQVDTEALFDEAGLLADPLPDPPASLRPDDELEWQLGRVLGVHWRLRQYMQVEQEPVDFAAFADDCWFGSFDLAGIPLVDGDLALGGVAIHDAEPAARESATSIAMERHRAMSWLMHGGDYTDAPTDT